jgi:hypothetical protein
MYVTFVIFFYAPPLVFGRFWKGSSKTPHTKPPKAHACQKQITKKLRGKGMLVSHVAVVFLRFSLLDIDMGGCKNTTRLQGTGGKHLHLPTQRHEIKQNDISRIPAVGHITPQAVKKELSFSATPWDWGNHAIS